MSTMPPEYGEGDLGKEPKPQPETATVREFILDKEYPMFTDEAKGRGGSPIKLKISDKIIVPLVLGRSPSKASKEDALTPFHPDNGHIIKPEDYNIDQRVQKREEERGVNINSELDPLYLTVHSSREELMEAGITEKKVNFLGITQGAYSPIMKRLMERLRVQLSFPSSQDIDPTDTRYIQSSRLEARGWETSFLLGELGFNFFYPADYGPLPVNNSLRGEGFTIYIPDDPALWNQIMIKFYLMPEEDQPETEPEPQPLPPRISGGFIKARY
jgi:hypothetical protein